ncbi:uncharacterized protein L3040_001064 [Drepanopeziza brunnea f. sp. 'multigermtubi']|uniref:Uncharacterized protein n=1 Tax=Marssonina brunnea f. sp. multigermtubi (strain MB_m1) TaxID=1072389 RepID=K1WHV0_MARBU|nr:uncharacterized protein MBM_09485 [Drepanopeziza brunnea f. sp. 'multigermtubi' MB_m1]EKD12451.1 hypothetical protein MBM_09485 [Drepanopeziza brunnea f. sp. 'multigermtubi' MB_m1]KAJ5054800.1 hypothetical protein L3040_001064 [Drepanopeziza brunnea f. sp. 'multigermtubi']
MMQSSQSTTICSILLALGFFLNSAYGVNRNGREFIGYRVVYDREAEYINSHLKPYRDPRLDDDEVTQIGQGFDLVNKPEGFQTEPSEEYFQWFCVVEADSAKLKAASKVWIPEHTYDDDGRERKLWFQSDETLLNYVKTKVEENPENAIRFSYMQYHPEEFQMVLPTSMVNNDELNLWAYCYKRKEDLQNYWRETIKWQRWNIAGDPKPRKSLYHQVTGWFGSSSGGRS